MEMLTSPYNLLDMLTLAHSLKMSSPGSLAVTASLHDLRVTLMSPPRFLAATALLLGLLMSSSGS